MYNHVKRKRLAKENNIFINSNYSLFHLHLKILHRQNQDWYNLHKLYCKYHMRSISTCLFAAIFRYTDNSNKFCLRNTTLFSNHPHLTSSLRQHHWSFDFSEQEQKIRYTFGQYLPTFREFHLHQSRIKIKKNLTPS